MYVDAETLITIGKVIGSLAVIGGVLIAAYKFWQYPKEQGKALAKLREEHREDIKTISKEQCLITYGVLACLRGLSEQGCNGPVTEAIQKIEKHLNEQAHDMEVHHYE